MKRTLVSLVALALVALAVYAQQPSAEFLGVWKEDVARSSYGNQAPPKMSQVTITPTGWVLASVSAKGELTSYAVTTAPDGSCVLIGLPAGYSCKQAFPDPRRHVWTLEYQGATVDTVNSEVLANGKEMRSTVKATPPGAAPFTQVIVWNKVSGATPAAAAPAAATFVTFPAKNGNVTFDHAAHSKRAKNDCAVCHPALFAQNAKAPVQFRPPHKTEEDKKTSCGFCHRTGGSAFATTGNCNKCHVRP